MNSAGYMGFVFASSSLPGVPVWETPPEVLKEVLNESIGEQQSHEYFHCVTLVRNDGSAISGFPPDSKLAKAAS